jgi:hypothetical protein
MTLQCLRYPFPGNGSQHRKAHFQSLRSLLRPNSPVLIHGPAAVLLRKYPRYVSDRRLSGCSGEGNIFACAGNRTPPVIPIGLIVILSDGCQGMSGFVASYIVLPSITHGSVLIIQLQFGPRLSENQWRWETCLAATQYFITEIQSSSSFLFHWFSDLQPRVGSTLSHSKPAVKLPCQSALFTIKHKLIRFLWRFKF